MPDDRELDHLIDSALSTYAEPRTSIEARVLANLSTETSKRTRRAWLPWAIALPIAACLVLLLALYPRRIRIEEPVRQAQHSSAPQTRPAQQSSIAQATQVPAHKPKPRIVAARSTPHLASTPPPPKLDIFPTPHPLSSQEQALIRYVANIPESDRKTLAAPQDKPIAPLAIAAIQIQPLAPLDKSDN